MMIALLLQQEQEMTVDVSVFISAFRSYKKARPKGARLNVVKRLELR